MKESKRIDGKFLAFGFFAPPVFSFLFYMIVSSFSVEGVLSEYFQNIFNSFPLYDNVDQFSPYEFEYFFAFFCCALLIPIMMPYWWRVTPLPFRNTVHGSRIILIVKLNFSVLFLVSIVVGSWFINVDSLSDRRSSFFRLSFENPLLYCVFFICPMSLVSWFISGAAKISLFKYGKAN